MLRRGKDRDRGDEPPISPLRERAREAADAIYCDNSARWFPTHEVSPIYSFLYDHYRGRPEDVRLRRLAEESLARLHDLARRLEESAVSALPPEWDQAKAALTAASEVFEAITRVW